MTTARKAARRSTPGAADGTLYIFSDGRFEDVKDFSLGKLQPVYVPVGSLDAENLAITAFRRGETRTGRSGSRPSPRWRISPTSRSRPSWSWSSTANFSTPRRWRCQPAESTGVVFPLAERAGRRADGPVEIHRLVVRPTRMPCRRTTWPMPR